MHAIHQPMCERPDLSGRAPSRVDSLSRFPSRPVLVGPSPFAPHARHITARARRRAQRPHTMRAIAPVSLAPISRVQRRRARVQARRTTDDVSTTRFNMAFVKLALTSTARSMRASLMSAPVKSTSGATIFIMYAPRKFAPRSLANRKSAPVKFCDEERGIFPSVRRARAIALRAIDAFAERIERRHARSVASPRRTPS